MLSNLLQMHLKLLQKKAIQKTGESTGDLVGNEIANKIIKISKISQQSNSETVTNEHHKEILKEIYISRRKTENY